MGIHCHHDRKILDFQLPDGLRRAEFFEEIDVANLLDALGQHLWDRFARSNTLLISANRELQMRRLRLESVLHHDVQIDWLAADTDPRPLHVWLKLDTGMHRLGFAPDTGERLG